jgi:hypothetical protein
MIKLTECLVYALIEFELVFLNNWLKGVFEVDNLRFDTSFNLFIFSERNLCRI